MEDLLDTKIVAGLERISEVFRFLLWRLGKKLTLSPIQIQLLIFIGTHNEKQNRVSSLAKEFNLTKPTISDSINTLISKGYLEKKISETDHRSFSLGLTKDGKKIFNKVSNYYDALLNVVKELSYNEKIQLWNSILKIINLLVDKKLITVQRMCFKCNYYTKIENKNYCKLMEKFLKSDNLLLDCNDFIPRDFNSQPKI